MTIENPQSIEAVAFRLYEEIRDKEYGVGIAGKGGVTKEYILRTYAECLDTVQGKYDKKASGSDFQPKVNTRRP